MEVRFVMYIYILKSAQFATVIVPYDLFPNLEIFPGEKSSIYALNDGMQPLFAATGPRPKYHDVTIYLRHTFGHDQI